MGESNLTEIRNYIDGDWCEPTGLRAMETYDPGSGKLHARWSLSAAADMEEAIAAAKEAFPDWRATPPASRARMLFKLKAILEDRFEDCARVTARDAGKTLDEARGEVRRAIEVIELACGVPSMMQGYCLEDVSSNIDCVAFRQPLGPVGIISPFNFPFMVVFWFLPTALACGNTVVVKPSERTPLSQQLVFEILDELDLPPGLVNMVNGDREVAEVLLRHPDVRAISFVGSTAVAKHIYATAAASGKRVQALGGAKNFVIVMPDAHLPGTVAALLGSTFGCAGQRCLAESVILCVGDDTYEHFVGQYVHAARTLRVGYGLDPTTDMGAVISREAVERCHRTIEGAVADGADLLLDGRGVEVAGYPEGYYVGPTILGDVSAEMKICQDEIFGPVTGVARVSDFESAMRIIENNPYGNAASIFTSSGGPARTFGHRAPASMVGVNIGIAAPMAYFSFGGARQSFFGDLKGHGREAFDFFTDRKVITSRWF